MKKAYLILIAAVCSALLPVSCRQQQKTDPMAEANEHIRLMAAANTTEKRNAEKAWAADSLDLNLLADDGLRTRFLHGWADLYRSSTGTDFPDKMAAASKKLLTRAASEVPGQVKPIVRTLCEYLVASDEVGIAAAVAAYTYGFDISPGEYSEIAERLLGATLLTGQRAPAIEGAGPMPSPPPSATILLFYEDGCRNCEAIIGELMDAYEILESMNVRVITVSSDTDPRIFETHVAMMPWSDKICDFQSFAGPNFRNYSVASTPTMWVIDGNGIVTGQFRTLDETGLLR